MGTRHDRCNKIKCRDDVPNALGTLHHPTPYDECRGGGRGRREEARGGGERTTAPARSSVDLVTG